jgi:hypothetical protein
MLQAVLRIVVAMAVLGSIEAVAQSHAPTETSGERTTTPSAARGKTPRVSSVAAARREPPSPSPAGHTAPAASGYVATGARASGHAAAPPAKKAHPVVSGSRPATAAADPTGDAPHGAAPVAAPATTAATDAETPHEVEPKGAPDPGKTPASRPTKLADVHSRITAALAELNQAALQTRADDADDARAGGPVARPSPRITLDWPMPHLELVWPAGVQPRPRE